MTKAAASTAVAFGRERKSLRSASKKVTDSENVEKENSSTSYIGTSTKKKTTTFISSNRCFFQDVLFIFAY